MEEVSKEVRLDLINQKLAIWNNTLYDAGEDAKVANIIENDNLKRAAEKRVREALKALEYFQGRKAELETELAET